MFEFEVDYTASAFPYRYEGTRTIRTNYDDEAQVRARAVREIARDGAFSTASVTIKAVRRMKGGA